MNELQSIINTLIFITNWDKKMSISTYERILLVIDRLKKLEEVNE